MFLSVWKSISQSLSSAENYISFAILFIYMCACRGFFLSHAECQRGHRYLSQKQKSRKALLYLSQFSSSACPRAGDGVPFAFAPCRAGLAPAVPGCRAAGRKAALAVVLAQLSWLLPGEGCQWANFGVHWICECIAPLNQGSYYYF